MKSDDGDGGDLDGFGGVDEMVWMKKNVWWDGGFGWVVYGRREEKMGGVGGGW